MPEQALVPFVAFALLPKHAGQNMQGLLIFRGCGDGDLGLYLHLSPIALSTLEVVTDPLLPWAWGP